MSYKVIELIRIPEYEGAIIENEESQQLYITSGYGIWSIKKEDLVNIPQVKQINKDRFLSFWNNSQSAKLIF